MNEFNPILALFQLLQWLLNLLLSPTPRPPKDSALRRPKIAVIGAGITGVSSAAHIIGHGFEPVLFEAGDERNLGGIWSSGYPDRKQIVSQVSTLWHRYKLEDRTKFNTKVTKVYKDGSGHWIVNNPSHGRFDGVIAAIGTCGDPKMPHIPNQEEFEGEIYHSSKLDGKDARGKKVVIIGGGASAVEALEFVAHAQSSHTTVLARSEKWIIPRNPLVDMLLSMNIFGRETFLSWIPELILRRWFYRELSDLAPPSQPLFADTPMVNSHVFDQIRSGNAQWLRGDIVSFENKGIIFNKRAKGVPQGGPGHEKFVEADIVIMATGYQRPSLSFLPEEYFSEEGYEPPNWYLQTFPPQEPSICANNCAYVNAIGTVGNWHIGIYTRLLLMFLIDPLARPQAYLMKRWIDMTKWLKGHAPGGAFDFFTYAELVYWFMFCVAINPFRWKWAAFIFFGVGDVLPRKIVEQEDKLGDGPQNGGM